MKFQSLVTIILVTLLICAVITVNIYIYFNREKTEFIPEVNGSPISTRKDLMLSHESDTPIIFGEKPHSTPDNALYIADKGFGTVYLEKYNLNYFVTGDSRAQINDVYWAITYVQTHSYDNVSQFIIYIWK